MNVPPRTPHISPRWRAPRPQSTCILAAPTLVYRYVAVFPQLAYVTFEVHLGQVFLIGQYMQPFLLSYLNAFMLARSAELKANFIIAMSYGCRQVYTNLMQGHTCCLDRFRLSSHKILRMSSSR